jgi:hypothetical protein
MRLEVLLPKRTRSRASVAPKFSLHMTKKMAVVRARTISVPRPPLTVSCCDSSATRLAAIRVNENNTSAAHGVLYELACAGHLDEKIFVIEVVDGNPELLLTRLGPIGRNGFFANGDNMGDPVLGAKAGRAGNLQT